MHPRDGAEPPRPDDERMRGADDVESDEHLSNPWRDADEPDDTGIRSLLSSLDHPAAPHDHLTSRIRRSIHEQSHTPGRALPPVEAETAGGSGLSRRVLIALAGGTAAAGVAGALVLSAVSLPAVTVQEALATTTLTGAGIPVTASATEYTSTSLTRQAARLIPGPQTGSTASSGSVAAPADDRAARTFAAVGSPTPQRSSPQISEAVDSGVESDVLACLRHLRIASSRVVAVDIARFDRARAAIVVTSDPGSGGHIVRAIDPSCPVLGDAVVAGPSLLPAQP